jgi:MFS superfamily sulfate permease-like transporter
MRFSRFLSIKSVSKSLSSQTFRYDLISGFLVFLIALPLSLGIAKASGFPPIAGVYSAIAGGMLASLFANAPLAIKGPAAGLIVIALGAVEALGYKGALVCVVLSGLIQVGFAFLRVGKYSDFFPSSPVHGLLAAIGIIIISKQIHSIFGVLTHGANPIPLFAQIPDTLMNLNPKVTLIGGLSLLIMFGWQVLPAAIRKVPAPLVVLTISVPLGYYLELHELHDYVWNGTKYHINPISVLVVLPEQMSEGIVFPNWKEFGSWTMWQYVFMFAIIGSLESVLSAKAVDSIDPLKRKTSYNRDLLAIGVSNTVLGLIGGLPIITEIVRSSANISNGGKTRWANFFHGAWMLLFVALATSLLNHIPLAALAAMLIFTGFRLASPQSFRHIYEIGKEQLIVFLLTIIVTLATDLLVGILVGIVAELVVDKIINRHISIKNLFSSKTVVETLPDNTFRIKINHAAVFSNYLSFKKRIAHIPPTANWILDLQPTTLIDHTFMEHIDNLKKEVESKGGTFKIIGLENFESLSDHPTAGKRKTNQ